MWIVELSWKSLTQRFLNISREKSPWAHQFHQFQNTVEYNRRKMATTKVVFCVGRPLGGGLARQASPISLCPKSHQSQSGPIIYQQVQYSNTLTMQMIECNQSIIHQPIQHRWTQWSTTHRYPFVGPDFRAHLSPSRVTRMCHAVHQALPWCHIATTSIYCTPPFRILPLHSNSPPPLHIARESWVLCRDTCSESKMRLD